MQPAVSVARSGPSTRRGRVPGRSIAVVLLAALGVQSAAPALGKVWEAGAYSFSDEFGGFTIDALGGSGTKDDPFRLRQTLYSSSPVTLVIRAIRPIRAFDRAPAYANGILHMRIETRNGSGQGWVEFEFELQEVLNQPSTFGDGLSFDQRTERQDEISSDAFGAFSRNFEPYDKLLFRDGRVDPGKVATFSMLITDYTPRWEFYLVQDPRIPST